MHRWDEETIVGLLSGPAEVLRQTWFGDLVLDQETLVRARKISLAPVEHRYEAELHVRTPPERDLERVMHGAGTARRIAARMAVMEQAASDLQGHADHSELAVRTGAALTDAAERAEEVAASIEGGRVCAGALADGRFDAPRDGCRIAPSPPSRSAVARLPQRRRAQPPRSTGKGSMPRSLRLRTAASAGR
jgi:hypothetical protein